MARNILLVLPCCIGDVVLATATLRGLRQAFPQARITWAVGRWSAGVLHAHPDLNAILDTGDAALPVKRPQDFWRFVRQVRAGRYDAVVSLVRSPLMSAALLLSGIPVRVGPDSGGRGFGYTVKAPVDPDDARHEADIYLSALAAWGLPTTDCLPNVTVLPEARAAARQRLQALGIPGRYIVVNPAGGQNPGMTMASKRYPAPRLAALIERLAGYYQAPVVLLAGGGDQAIVEDVQQRLPWPVPALAGVLSFAEIAALAHDALFYLGNDTGLTHLAAAAGARTAMILGPSDPRRYAPYNPGSLALWRPSAVGTRGVAAAPPDWNWERDGITPEACFEQITAWLPAAPA
jgi:ADP-heptose:LPS heptosyltransferase